MSAKHIRLVVNLEESTKFWIKHKSILSILTHVEETFYSYSHCILCWQKSSMGN